jgi:hypothetical protein
VTSWWDGTYQHVAYISNDRRVHELYYEVGIGPWKHADLHSDAGSDTPPAAVNSALTSWWDGTYHHVVYVGGDRHVHELYYEFGAGPWKHNDLTSAAIP